MTKNASRRACVLACALLLPATALIAQTKPAAKGNYMDLFNQARAAAAQRDYGDAEEKVLAALEINPNHPGSIALLHQLRQSAPKADIIGSKYKSVIIPIVEFKDATVQSCFEYLKTQTAAVTQGKTQINFVYNLPEDMKQKRISMRLKSVPLATAIDYMTQLAGAEKRLEKYAVVIAEPGRASGPLETEASEVRQARASLRALKLTSVEFKDLPVAQAFDQLREFATRDSGGTEQPNIIVALSDADKASKKISMDLKDIPFFEALRLICENQDLQWKAGSYAITVSPLAAAPAANAAPAGTEQPAPAESGSVVMDPKANSGPSSIFNQ
jgi:hypothetical protein